MSWRSRAIPVQGARRLGTILLLALLVLSLGQSKAQAAGQSGVTGTCVKAGLMRPRGLEVHFWLQILEYSTAPASGLDFYLGSMPTSCSGYSRNLSVNIRYKTTLKPWRIRHGFSNNGHITRWIPVWHQNEGTGAKIWSEFASPESSSAPWGKVQHVKAHAKLLVKDLSTGKIAGRKMLPVRASFVDPRRAVVPVPSRNMFHRRQRLR